MSPLGRLLVALIGLYRRLISPLLGPHCRFAPTCSEYAAEAIRTHGAVRGGWMAATRVARCHPWSAGGVDHVPEPAKGRPRPDLRVDEGRPRPDLRVDEGRPRPDLRASRKAS